jgi:P-type Ca2+ transporter type 2C
MKSWHLLYTTEVLHRLGTIDSYGISQVEADLRLSEYGKNELIESPSKSMWQMLWEQLTATTVLVLIVAAIISALLKDYKDTIAILAIVLFNTILGLNQEYRAIQAFAALKKFAVPKVNVCRDGQWQELSSCYLVPGDLLLLEAGDFVPADCRLLESINLQVQEAAFTGESLSVEKSDQTMVGEDLSLGERQNMVYLGTVVTYGRGKAIVTETGMTTELGKIAQTVQTAELEQTPLQQRLEELGKKLAIASILLVLIILVLGLLRGENLYLMILTAVSIAVAVIPEGLPAVVTIALAIGSLRMLKRQALIRKLPAVETLGSVTIICSDKTGTLTENRMTVTTLQMAKGSVNVNDCPSWESNNLDGAIALLLMGSVLCNNTVVTENTEVDTALLGEPTEIAFVVAGDRLGLHKPVLDLAFPRISEIPFDSERKRMTTIHQVTSSQQSKESLPFSLISTAFLSLPLVSFTKGSFNLLIDRCSHILVNDRIEMLDTKWEDQETLREHIQTAHNNLAQTGARVLLIAYRPLDQLPESIDLSEIEDKLILIGLIAMIDPLRSEAKKAVETCQKAGIRPIMITGDHALTAKYIAQELGIFTGESVLTGKELSQLSSIELENIVDTVSVYAHVSPQQKLNIVEALQHRGHIVAMTGDGINDAPALRKANIGVAMGITGTDIAKEAADMVLLDDNFATIVAAVQEGRVIYDNIRKFIKYSMTGNASGVWIMLIAPFLTMPLPLQPLQILWVNLLADGLLALALSVEPAEFNTMNRPPYNPSDNIFSKGVGRDIIWIGCLLGFAILLLGYHYWSTGQENWQTMIFVTLAFSRMSLALGMRSQQDSVFKIGLFTNPFMLGAVITTFILQLAVIYIPELRQFFNTTTLSFQELGISLAISTIGFWGVEIEKWSDRLRIRRQSLLSGERSR